MSRRLIGIAGFAGSGKDTLADYLVERHWFEKYALAEPIKAALNAVFGWRPEFWDSRDWKESFEVRPGVTPRTLAQTLGGDWGRGVSQDLWLSFAQMTWESGTKLLPDYRLVIPDIRYENEAEWIRSEGGDIVFVASPNTYPVARHESENGIVLQLDDILLANDTTPAALFAHAERCLGLNR